MPSPNAAVDIYRGFNASSPYPSASATPAATGVPGELRHYARNGRFGRAAILHWTHLLLLSPDVDIRSAYNSQLNSWQHSNADTVLLADYPIDGWCTAFVVVLVQRIRGPRGAYLRAYLDRVQPREGPCTPEIVLPCCPDPMPATLQATVPSGTGCPCLDGVVVTLAYDPVSQSWTGSTEACASETLTITFTCGTSSCDDATITVTLDNHGTAGPVTAAVGCSCTPLNVLFTGINFPIQGAECDGAITVVVTV